MDQKKLSELFNKFVGQRLKNPDRTTCETDAVLEELKSTAESNGLRLRVIWPGQPSDRAARPNRVTINVTETDGKLHIAQFKLG